MRHLNSKTTKNSPKPSTRNLLYNTISSNGKDRKTVSFMLDRASEAGNSTKRSGLTEKEAGLHVSQNNRKSMTSLIKDIENEFKSQYRTLEMDLKH